MSPSPRPIVVGFDGSDAARGALTWAAAEAASRNLPLTVVHTVSPPVTSNGFGYVVPVELDIFSSLEEAAKKGVDEALTKLTTEYPNLETVADVSFGSPSAVLIEASETAELVVVGSRGLGGFRGLLLGSVGSQVATHSACPVVVVRGESATGGVVVGIDGSDVSNEALGFAFDFASRRELPLNVLHAWDVPPLDLLATPTGPFESLEDLEADEVRSAAETLAGYREQYPDVAVTETVMRSSPITALLDAAKGASLVVLGSRGHGEFVGAVLGSVSQSVLHRAKVPVAIVTHGKAGARS